VSKILRQSYKAITIGKNLLYRSDTAKSCRKCGKFKKLEEFPLEKRNKDGRCAACRVCERARIHEWGKGKGKAKRAATMKKYQQSAKGKAAKKTADKKSTPKCRAKFPDKYSARSKVAVSIKNGSLEKQPCEVCGEIKVDAHHDDYAKPLDVRWLCRQHHAEHHKREREAKM